MKKHILIAVLLVAMNANSIQAIPGFFDRLNSMVKNNSEAATIGLLGLSAYSAYNLYGYVAKWWFVPKSKKQDRINNLDGRRFNKELFKEALKIDHVGVQKMLYIDMRWFLDDSEIDADIEKIYSNNLIIKNAACEKLAAKVDKITEQFDGFRIDQIEKALGAIRYHEKIRNFVVHKDTQFCST